MKLVWLGLPQRRVFLHFVLHTYIGKSKRIGAEMDEINLKVRQMA